MFDATYMLSVRNTTWMSTLDLVVEWLESHAVFQYASHSFLERSSSSIRLKTFVVVEVLCNPCPIRLAWLVICSDWISCDVNPRSAELDILIVVVIATSLTSTALKLHQHINLQLSFLCHKIDETSWGNWILQKLDRLEGNRNVKTYNMIYELSFVHRNGETRNWIWNMEIS